MYSVSAIINPPIVHEFHQDHKCRGFLPPFILESIREAEQNQDQIEHLERRIQLQEQWRKKRTKILKGKEKPQIEQSNTLDDRIKIYDAHGVASLPGTFIANPVESGDEDVKNGYHWVSETSNFLKQVFNRDSVDNRGMVLKCSVNYPEFNAYWNGSQLVLGESKNNQYFESFTVDPDITAHEIGHGVTQFNGYLPYSNQSGALNESFSDVYGCSMKQFINGYDASNELGWLIGDKLLKPWGNGEYDVRGALRTMTEKKGYENHPLLGDDPQPKHMAEYVSTSKDDGGVHTNSGIFNHAFYLANQKFSLFDNEKYAYSYALDGLASLWYQGEAELKRVLGTMKPSFDNAAGAIITVAENRWGNASKQVGLLREAFDEVGIKPMISKPSRCQLM